MEQRPDPDFRARHDTATISISVVTGFLVSTSRSLARGAAFLYRVAKGLDRAMGRILEARQLQNERRSDALSLVGSGAILISAFAPILNVPVVGSVSYFNGNSDFAVVIGILLIVLGTASLIFALIEKYLWLYAIGFCALVIAIGTFASWRWYLARAGSASSAAGGGLLDYFTQSASKGLVGRSNLSFGFPLLIYGAVLVTLAALMRPRAAAGVNPELPRD